MIFFSYFSSMGEGRGPGSRNFRLISRFVSFQTHSERSRHFFCVAIVKISENEYGEENKSRALALKTKNEWSFINVFQSPFWKNDINSSSSVFYFMLICFLFLFCSTCWDTHTHTIEEREKNDLGRRKIASFGYYHHVSAIRLENRGMMERRHKKKWGNLISFILPI